MKDINIMSILRTLLQNVKLKLDNIMSL